MEDGHIVTCKLCGDTVDEGNIFNHLMDDHDRSDVLELVSNPVRTKKPGRKTKH